MVDIQKNPYFSGVPFFPSYGSQRIFNYRTEWLKGKSEEKIRYYNLYAIISVGLPCELHKRGLKGDKIILILT